MRQAAAHVILLGFFSAYVTTSVAVVPDVVDQGAHRRRARHTTQASDTVSTLGAIRPEVSTHGGAAAKRAITRFHARYRCGLDSLQIDTRHHTRSEEHTSELQSLMRISYAVFCLKTKTNQNT